MKLFIDTSKSEETIVGLGEKIFKYKTPNFKSQKLLEAIEKTLKENKKTLNDLTEIEIFLGPGSFTGLRVGVAVANTLSWSLDIPVNGKKQLVSPVYKNK